VNNNKRMFECEPKDLLSEPTNLICDRVEHNFLDDNQHTEENTLKKTLKEDNK